MRGDTATTDRGCNSLDRSDSQLIAASLQGDVRAFQQLYERYWRMAVGVTLCVTRDRHLAEDAAQEGFAMAARQLANLRQVDRFPYWLRSICRRMALRLLKQRPRTVPLDVEPPAGIDRNTDERRLALLNAINQLEPEGHELIVLHYFSELSYAEISRTLGVTPASIHGRLQRARRKLADLLKRDHFSGAFDVRPTE